MMDEFTEKHWNIRTRIKLAFPFQVMDFNNLPILLFARPTDSSSRPHGINPKVSAIQAHLALRFQDLPQLTSKVSAIQAWIASPTRQDLLWLLQRLSGSSPRPYGFKIVELGERAVGVNEKEWQRRGGKGREGCKVEGEKTVCGEKVDWMEEKKKEKIEENL
jgi:hypothetical protein